MGYCLLPHFVEVSAIGVKLDERVGTIRGGSTNFLLLHLLDSPSCQMNDMRHRRVGSVSSRIGEAAPRPLAKAD